MNPTAPDHARQVGAIFSEGAPFTPSAFVGLLAPIHDCQSEDSIRRDFFEATGLLPGFIVRSADFIVVLAHSSRTEVVRDPTLGVVVLLHGDVYLDSGDGQQTAGQFVLDAYRMLGIDRAARDIDGSYAALLVTPRDVSVVIDRVGSRKIFCSQDACGFWISTTLALHPRRKTDAAGVASLIINRYQYRGRTLYQSVRTLERASIHTFARHGPISRNYWQYDFSGVSEVTFTSNLVDRKHELATLIQRAVHRRLPRTGQVWCSLSGGVDSRGILGALLSKKGELPSPLRALSYGMSGDDDQAVAKELCIYAGIEHRLVRFQGSLNASIRENASHCEGLVFFYLHSLSGLQQTAAEFGTGTVMFVGDECFGWNDMVLTSFDETLQQGIGIRSPAKVPSYYSYGKESHLNIQSALQSDIDSLKQQYGAISSWHDLKDTLYLDQRLSNMLLPWREFHYGRYVSVANPLIDNAILDFMKSVPTTYRLDKRLLRETLSAAYPDLFGIRLARPGGNNMHVLQSLFLREKASLEHLVGSFDSDLDEVIPPDVIMAGLIDVLDRMTLARIQLSPWLLHAAERIRRKVSRVRVFLRGPMRGGKSAKSYGQMALSPIQMATLLQLRYFLRTRREKPA